MVEHVNNFYTFSESCSSSYVSALDMINAEDYEPHNCEVCDGNSLIDFSYIRPVFECGSVTKRKKFPDLMLYGGRIIHTYGSWYIVSEKFVELFNNSNFKGASFYRADMMIKWKKEYRPLEQKYYVMVITGRANLDMKKMNISSCQKCEVCGTYIFDGVLCPLFNKNGVYPAILDTSSWDGSDVFNDGDCTEYFTRTIIQSKLTGFEFQHFEQKFDKFDNIKFITRESQL